MYVHQKAEFTAGLLENKCKRIMLKIILAFMGKLQYPSEIDGLRRLNCKKKKNIYILKYRSNSVLPMLKFKVSSVVHELKYLQQQEKRRIFPIHFEV